MTTKRKAHDQTGIRVNSKRERGCDEIQVIGSGKSAYVWIGNGGRHVCNFGGRASLLKLAKAIREAVGK